MPESPTPPDEIEVAPTAADQFAPDRALCMKCGYSLGGLRRSDFCPECGTPIALSLRDGKLINSSPEYLALLHNGVFLILASIIVQILAIMLMILPPLFAGFAVTPLVNATSITVTEEVMSLGVAAMAILGWWRPSARDPRAPQNNRGEQPRRIVRVVVLIEACTTVGSQLLGVINQSLMMSGPFRGGIGGMTIVAGVFGFVWFVLMAVRFFASMQYLRWLAPRIPNRKLFNRAGTMQWLGPILCTVGAFCLFIGPIVALIMYYNMLEWLRLDLKRIRREQRLDPDISIA